MCALDAYQQTTTCFTCLKAFRVSGLHPLSSGVVLGRPEVRRSDDGRETAIQVKHPDRAFTGSQELTSDERASRGWESAGRADSWREMPGPALCRRLTWSLVGTNSFARRRWEASMPMKATPSREGRRADPGSQATACASVVGGGRLRICAPPGRLRIMPAWSSFAAPAACIAPAALPFLNRFRSMCVAVRLLRPPAPGRPSECRRFLSQRCAATAEARPLSGSAPPGVAGPASTQ
jgi:hypothetical protein